MDTKKGLLEPLGLASAVAFAYAILFVALVLASDKTVTSDGVVLPAISIFLVINTVRYLFFKRDKSIPHWLVVSSFLLAIIIAIVMTVIL